MRLHDDDLAAYVGLTHSSATASEQSRQLEQLRASIHQGHRNLADTHIAKDGDAGLLTALRLVPIGENTLMLRGPLPADKSPDAPAAALLAETMARAREMGATSIITRPNPKHVGPLYRRALLAHGFHDLGERIEFKSPLAPLPSDEGTPLTWKRMDQVGRAAAVALFERASEGDPHGLAEDEDAGDALAGYLSTPDLTSGPTCVQVGYEDERPVAFLCAQVDPSDGWSRITYMGLVPEARGRGLGVWLHRKGFQLLREQGGILYHGGTAADNPGMLRLFREHGCVESGRMLELEWHAPTSCE